MKQGKNQPRKPADRVPDVRPHDVEHPEPKESNEATLNSVTCHNFENHIHVLLDRRASLLKDELLQRHALSCAPCASILADYESLDDSVSQISIATLSKIAGVNLEEVPPAKSQFGELSRALFVMTSIAALFLVAIGLGGLASNDGQAGFAHLSSSQSNAIAFADPVDPTDRNLATTTATPNDPAFAQSFTRPFSPTFSSTTTSVAGNSNHLPTHALRLPGIRKAALSVFRQSEIDAIEPFLNPVETTVETVKAKNAQSWKQLTKQLDPISPFLRMSTELPGFRSIHDSVNVTVNLIQQTFSKSLSGSKPLDFSFNPGHHANA